MFLFGTRLVSIGLIEITQREECADLAHSERAYLRTSWSKYYLTKLADNLHSPIPPLIRDRYMLTQLLWSGMNSTICEDYSQTPSPSLMPMSTFQLFLVYGRWFGIREPFSGESIKLQSNQTLWYTPYHTGGFRTIDGEGLRLPRTHFYPLRSAFLARKELFMKE